MYGPLLSLQVGLRHQATTLSALKLRSGTRGAQSDLRGGQCFFVCVVMVLYVSFMSAVPTGEKNCLSSPVSAKELPTCS